MTKIKNKMHLTYVMQLSGIPRRHQRVFADSLRGKCPIPNMTGLYRERGEFFHNRYKELSDMGVRVIVELHYPD